MKYIDTSALVKYYGKPELERGTEKITDMIEKAKQGKEFLVTSIFTIGETVSVFDRWVRIKAITEEEMSNLVTRFFTDVQEMTESGGIIIESISSLSVLFSVEHILKHHMSINDSLHLYTALKHKKKLSYFVSADENQLYAAEKEGLKIFNPEN